ncbi:MAG TPA: SDR family oxidoreductase [Solirubrobacteraceae bacterium]|jgi:nucleoside-diphosphate-sugar epimerase|nr:SDR family oxidoreductase [Solirubrobacteraceae bacterium]
MRVFVTGATGFIGSAVVSELIAAGHEVVGLARSDEGAAALGAAGAEVQRGTLDDLDLLRGAAEAADGVIHTAYVHDFSQMAQAAQTDLRVIETLGAALEGSDRPLVTTFGTAMITPGEVVTEEGRADPASAAHPRLPNEPVALALASRGVRSTIIRLAPSVHGEGDHGFVPVLIDVARSRGAAAYVGDGANRWPGVHRLDAARLFRLALERGTAGSVFHGIAEEGVPTRRIAEVMGRHLDVPVISVAPEAAAEHFGWIGAFFALDIPASSALTQQRLGWEPARPGLIADLDEGHYFLSSVVAFRG